MAISTSAAARLVAAAIGIAALGLAPAARAVPALFAQGELTSGADTPGDWFGYATAVSADGAEAAIGAPAANGERGAVYLFAREQGTWTLRAALVDPDPATAATAARSPVSPARGEDGEEEEEGALTPARFGAAVAMSADGSELLVGAPGQADGRGAGFIFALGTDGVRAAGELQGSAAELGEGRLGRRAALSADGSTAVLGAPRERSGAGGVWVYRAGAGGAWGAPTRLAAPESRGEEHLGGSLGVSADDTTVLAGAPGEDSWRGGAWIFRTAAGEPARFEPVAHLLDPSLEPAHFGRAAALAPDGRSAVVGAYLQEGQSGAVYSFAEAAGGWGQSGPMLTPPSGSAGRFGGSVALSPDGSGLAVGATGAAGEGSPGTAETYQEGADGEWIPGQLLAPAGGGHLQFGTSVAMAALGQEVIVGGLRAAVLAPGAAWAFGSEPPAAGGPGAGSGEQLGASGPAGTPAGGDPQLRVLPFTSRATPARCRVTLLSRALALRGWRAILRLRSSAACQVTVELLSGGRRAHLLARSRATLRRGSSSMALALPARASIARARTLPARLRLSGASGALARAVAVTLRR